MDDIATQPTQQTQPPHVQLICYDKLEIWEVKCTKCPCFNHSLELKPTDCGARMIAICADCKTPYR